MHRSVCMNLRRNGSRAVPRPCNHFSASCSFAFDGKILAIRTRGLALRGSSSSSMALALAGVKLRPRLMPFSLPLLGPVPDAATPA